MNKDKDEIKNNENKKYRVMINGRNFLIDIGSGLIKYGFFTTRFVEAPTPDKAELMAVESIRQWGEIITRIKNKKDDPPMLYAEEIVELRTFDGINRGVEKGASWYPEKENEYENV